MGLRARGAPLLLLLLVVLLLLLLLLFKHGVYNHLSSRCTFICLPLKKVKLLHWEQTTNRASKNIKNTQLSESELSVNISC